MADDAQIESAINISQAIKVCSPLTPGKPAELGVTGSTARNDAENVPRWDTTPTTYAHLSSRSGHWNLGDGFLVATSGHRRSYRRAHPPTVCGILLTKSDRPRERSV